MSELLTLEPGRVEELVARDRALRLQRFSTSSLTWLAAVPEWTDQLALDCGFPGMSDGQDSADSFIDSLARARLVELRQELDPSGETITAFWVPESMRSDLAQYLSNVQPRAVSQTYVSSIASAFESVRSRRSTQALEQWLAVARQVSDPSGAWLVDQVSMRVAEGETTLACGLVAAAEALGDVLGDPIASVARRARTRIDRGYREAEDRRQLRHYYRRRAIEAEVAELVWGRSSTWAIHLLGGGGMGKTSIVRYLASGQFARDDRRPAVLVARVDFDHLDPRYPEDRPAELLLSLAWDLTGYAQTRQAVRALRQVEDLSEALHESIALSPERRPNEQLLTQVIDAFAKYLGQLGDRVVLVLDTCEELAKLHAPGVVAPVVVRTFDLVERVAHALPGVRVVFAGRRWLAQPAVGISPRSAESWLPVRPYLKVVRVDGFTRAEAEGYLRDRSADDRGVLELREAILARCEQPGVDGETHYNPFELVAYADWAASDPELNEETLTATSGDPYIEQRIIGRIGSPTVREVLPIAVELGRFDRAMLERAVASRQLDANATFDGLAGLEWIRTVAFTADGRPRQIELDENVRKRLRTVIAADALRFPLNRARLGRDLGSLLENASFADLSAEAVSEAIRLLPVEEAGTVWEKLEARIAESEAWAWASTVVPFVAGTEAERSAGDGRTILAAIRATHAAATLRVAGRPGIHALWREVAQLAPRDPNAFRAGRLAARAQCGLLADGDAGDGDVGDGDDAAIERISGLIESHGPVGSILALLTGLSAERINRSAGLMRLLNLACEVETYSSAAALLVRAELALLESDGPAAAQACDTAMARAATHEPERWIDWVAPPHLIERCRLARLRVALARGEPLDALPIDDWRADALAAVPDIDRERLLSEALTFELAHRLPEENVLTSLEASDTYDHARRVQTSWHRAAAPLAVTIAAGWSAVGQPTRARDLLSSRRELAISVGNDPDTIRACDAALIALARTYRTTDMTETVRRVSRSFEADQQLRGDAWAALALNDGESCPSVEYVGDWHQWWRSQIRRADSSPGWLDRPIDSTATSNPTVAVDAREALLLSKPSSVQVGWDVVRRQQSELVETGLLLRDGDGQTLGTLLRAEALDDHWPVLSPTVLAQLPPRLVAEAALAEGELLALRLPARAVPLLALAEAHFKRANDSWGARRALILRVLASSRADAVLSSGIEEISLEAADDAVWENWKRRIALVNQLRSGPVTEPVGRSPELDPRPLPPVVAVPPAHPPVEAPSQAAPPIAPSHHREPRVSRRAVVVVVVIAALLVLTLVGLAALGARTTPPPVGATPTVLATPTPATSTDSQPSTLWLGLGMIVLALLGVVLAARLVSVWLGDLLRQLRLPLKQDSVAFSVTRDGTAIEIAACEVVVDTAGRFSVTRQAPTIVPLADEGVPSVDAWASKIPEPGEQDIIIPFDVGHMVDQPWDLWFSKQLHRTDILCVRCTPSASGRAWAPLKDWATMPAAYRGVTTLAPEASSRTTAQNGLGRPHRLLYLVGAPVPTAGGWRLRVEGAQSEASQVATRSAYVGEELLSADALPLLGSGLVVLQAEPVDGLPEPLDTLRAGFCGFAQSVLDRGAAAVVLIPPLPDWLAAQVIDGVWQTFGLAAKQPSAQVVLQFVSNLRRQIGSAHERDDASALAPSLDVMLYFRSES